MKAVQNLAASCTLLAASLLAHILAGGSPLSYHDATALLMTSVAIAVLLVRGSEDPIRVTIAIFIAQNAGHFILGGPVENSAVMLAAHISFGLLSYQLLRFFAKNLPGLGELFLSIFPVHITFVLPHLQLQVEHPNFTYRSLATPYFSLTQSRRAPPSF
jgi:Na+/H+ antiporter NhaD/arsenite permease-like protein